MKAGEPLRRWVEALGVTLLAAAAVLGWSAAVPTARAQSVSPESGGSTSQVADAAPGAASGEEAAGVPGGQPAAERAEGTDSSRRTEVPPEARERIRRGMDLLERGDYDAALAEFERVHELLRGHPLRFRVLLNIARAHEKRQRYDLALDYYHRYLREGGARVPDRARVEATIETLRGFLATLRIESNVPAQVWVDDRLMGEAPGEVLVPGGRHVVELRAEGYEPARAEVQVPPRAERALTFEMKKLADEYRGLPRAYFWSATSLAGALAVASAIFGARTLLLRSDLQTRLDDPTERLRVTGEDYDALASSALVADVLLLGTVLVAGGAVLLGLNTDWSGGAPSPYEADHEEVGAGAGATALSGPTTSGGTL